MDRLKALVSEAINWVALDPYTGSKDYSRIDVASAHHLTKWIPATKPLFFEFENQWNYGGPATLWARSNYYVPIALVVLYVLVIFGIKASMEKRKFFDMRVPQMYWNACLAIFSICGALRMMPFMLAFLFNEGKHAALCTSPVIGYGGAGPSALWTCLFIFSKVPELCDTVFIVLNKKPLMFLHWYHHITVLLYCWHSYATRASVGLSFAAMNFTVHAFMYTYYTIQNKASLDLSRAKKVVPEAKAKEAMKAPTRLKNILSAVAPFITVMQISQMVVGVYVMCAVFPHLNDQKTVLCHTSRSNWVWGLIMYMSYFVLFVLFAIEKYVCPKKRNAPIKED
jgi:hypothetical protein